MARTGPTIVHPTPLDYVHGILQAYCVGACCGYEAYDINAWRLTHDVDLDGDDWLLTVLDQLDAVLEIVMRHRGRIITNGELRWNRKGECREFYERIRTEALRALVHTKGRAVFNPEWLKFNDRAVELIARSIRKKRSFGDAVVLADALEESGCETEELVTRCRSVQPDAKANWVVELLFAGAEGVFSRPIEPTPDPPRFQNTPEAGQ